MSQASASGTMTWTIYVFVYVCVCVRACVWAEMVKQGMAPVSQHTLIQDSRFTKLYEVNYEVVRWLKYELYIYRKHCT